MPSATREGNESISLNDLAAELDVPVERLQPLIEHQYLTVLTPDTVLRPLPAAMTWLRTMFQPTIMRPWLPTEMVANLTGVTANDVRRLCLMYNIPLQDDPVFGELMSVAAFHRFFNQLHHFRDPSRFDRQAMLTVLHSSIKLTDSEEKAVKAMPYSKRIEKEIRRIARLKEPDRTFRAVALWEAYREAKTVMECWAKYRGRVAAGPEIPQMQELQRVVERSVGPSPEAHSTAPPEDV